jgi:hypothetical protein
VLQGRAVVVIVIVIVIVMVTHSHSDRRVIGLGRKKFRTVYVHVRTVLLLQNYGDGSWTHIIGAADCVQGPITGGKSNWLVVAMSYNSQNMVAIDSSQFASVNQVNPGIVCLGINGLS